MKTKSLAGTKLAVLFMITYLILILLQTLMGAF